MQQGVGETAPDPKTVRINVIHHHRVLLLAVTEMKIFHGAVYNYPLGEGWSESNYMLK